MGQSGEVGVAAQDPGPLLEALLDGPTVEEQTNGLWSVIPVGTTLQGVRVQEDRSVVVRLRVPPEALGDLDHGTFEGIVEQVGWTLEPLGWRDLRIETWDPSVGDFVPLASFLPEIPSPRKETVLSGEEAPPLSSAGVGQVGAVAAAQSQGALTGRTVYVSAGHGWEWNGYAWRAQRPPYPNPPYAGPIIEDHNNAEAVDQYLLRYLENAGAQAWPVRERDMNGSEVIVDNDSPVSGSDYVETGVWHTSTQGGTGYAGTDYRWAGTVVGAASATATWSATLPAEARYAVYVWYRPGSNRAPDARYTVHHAGGETSVVVDQRHHGLTWHYIGTYGFRAGEEARVTLTNQSAEAGQVVIADAVRFGGGTFDDLAGIETSATYAPGKPWWEVATFYQSQRMGVNPDDYPDFNDVIARPIYARWEHAGTGDDALYVSWHSNGYNGYQEDASGSETYVHNGEDLTRTVGSLELQHAIHTELVHDIRAGWDPAWVDRGEKQKNLGELRLLWDDDPAVRMPGALVEIAFHDHPDDTDALKEPLFNRLVARAIYQGIVKYFEQRDGIDLALLPEPPSHLAVQNVGGGRLRVSWGPSPTDAAGLLGDPATGYRVYTSTDGLGWSDGVPVVATTAYTVAGLSPGQVVFVRVTATNEGGESLPTETLGARVGDDVGVLLVNGFDRLNNTMLVADYDPVEGYNLRMFLDRMNRYDYAVQHGEVISYPFDSASNEAVADGVVGLGDYAVVDWILGEESAQDETLDGVERSLLENFLANGGALFLSGTEVGWHLDYLGTDSAFYRNVLRAGYAGDDAETYQVAPVAGSIFEGLAVFRFDAPGEYDADYPDQLAPASGSQAALTYDGGLGGTAAVQYAAGCERLVYLGFPFETVKPEQRPGVMARVMDFLDLCLGTPVDTRITAPASGSALNVAPSFQGEAEVSDEAVLDRVDVQIWRARDGVFWTESGWGSEEVWVLASGSDTWSYTLPALDDSDYRLRARAWTRDGYSDTTPAEVVFTYDTTAPASTSLVTPTSGVTVPTGKEIALSWQPVAPDGGASLAYRVRLDGQIFTTTQPSYTAANLAAGPHTWGVQVFDAAGNRSGWVTDTFSVRGHSIWLPILMRNFEFGATGVDVLVNGGFESDGGWVLNQLAIYDTTPVHSGARSGRVGVLPGEPESSVFSSVEQTVDLPVGGDATLRLWVYPIGEEGDLGDWHYVGLRDQSGVYHALGHWQSDARAWEVRQYDLSAFVGQTVTLYVGTRNDGDDDTAALYIDDAVLEVYP